MSKPTTFKDFVEKKFGQVKTASAETVTKTADAPVEAEAEVEVVEEKEAVAETVTKEAEQEEAESSGQLDVEPLHQVGESTPSPHKEKEGDGGEAANKEAEKDEADDSKQPAWEGKKENNNDPDSGKHHTDKDAETAEGEVKEAKEVVEAVAKEAEEAKVAACDCPSDCECKCDDGKPCKKSCGPKACMASDETTKKEAEVKEGWIKVSRYMKTSNLDPKTKTWIKNYWKQLFPGPYADAMTADK